MKTLFLSVIFATIVVIAVSLAFSDDADDDDLGDGEVGTFI